MPTSVVDYNARRFMLRFKDGECEEVYSLKFDVCVLSKNDSEEWVEIFQAEEQGDFVENRLILGAPASEVAELLEKILSFIREVMRCSE